MSALLLILFLTCGIMFYGNGLPYRDLFYKYQTRDDYYEDYYLRKIPKLRTSPDKARKFFINHLSWFPVDSLVNERKVGRSLPHGYYNKRSNVLWNLGLDEEHSETTTHRCHKNVTHMKDKLKHSFENLTGHIHTNWTDIKTKSSNSVHKMEDYLKHAHLKEKIKNATHPLRYRGPKGHKNHTNNNCYVPEQDYKNGGPNNIHMHPKSSHVEVLKSTICPNGNPSCPTEYPPPHFSFPRKIKVIIDLNHQEKQTKFERSADEKSYLANAEGDPSNSTNVLETAGEMAMDLAGRVTNLWHCVLGAHHIPDTKDVRFFLYTRRNVIQPELLTVNYNKINEMIQSNPSHVDVDCIDLPPEKIEEFQRISDENREIIKSNFLNIKAPTKILIHGYTGSYKDSRMAKIKDAYLTRGRYNVIQVDWEMLAAPPCYISVTHHSKFVGETIAQFLNGLYLVGLNMSLVHLVGFSLGAQVAGFTGNNATIVPVCRITGLDPALPLFLHTEPSGHLDKLDAKFVDVIHTCGGILAMLDPLGHVDFYPNGGTRQPGCEFSNLKCSHSRAPQYFAESVVSTKRFTGQLCLTWEEYIGGDCNNSTNTSYMGEPCSRRSQVGKYYLLTKSKEPFVL